MYPMHFEKGLNIGGGYQADTKEPGSDISHTRLQERLNRSVAFFFYFILYTFEGRQLCRVHRAGLAGKTPRDPDDTDGSAVTVNTPYFTDTEIRLKLTPVFEQYLSQPVLHAAIECIIAGGHIAELLGSNSQNVNFVELTEWQANYQQNLSVVTWGLWEGFQDQEFSLGW